MKGIASQVLYSSKDGTSGNVTLKASAAGFDVLEVFFKTNDGEYGSQRVYSPNGKKIALGVGTITAADGAGWYKSQQYSVSGTKMSRIGFAGESGIGQGAAGSNWYGAVLVVAVVGHRLP